MNRFVITFSTIVEIMILCLWKLCGIVVNNGGKTTSELLIISDPNPCGNCC